MSGILDFVGRFGSEEACIVYLAEVRWPGGYVCRACLINLAEGNLIKT